MKKELKEKLYNKVIEILDKYDLKVLIYNYNSISKDLIEIEKKRDTLIEVKHDEIEKEVFESKNSKDLKLKNTKDIHEKYENILNEYRYNIELLTLIRKTYKIIINNGLYLICNEFTNIIINNCKNKRDLNEFLSFFEYDKTQQKYKLDYCFRYDAYHSRFKISYDIPSKSAYNIFENSIYMNYSLNMNNNYIWSLNYYNYENNKNKIVNSDQYELKINNAFKPDTIKKQCEKLLKIHDEEISKQYKFILESNKKIDEANIYNLDGFKKYSVI